MNKGQWTGAILLGALGALTVVALWRTLPRGAARETLARRPEAVMGTTCDLIAVVGPGGRAQTARALERAEAALRGVEAAMSAWLEDSEIARLNQAPEGREIPLSRETLDVLRLSREAYEFTGGAFDITCRPLIELWREAGRRGALPSPAEIEAARAASNWARLELTERGAIKRAAAARVDLGGIAKGYAIDRALDTLRAGGALGGLVDAGGDLRCFGKPPAGGERWIVDVRNPFGGAPLGRLNLSAGRAVCTSGDYARYVEIEGRRYSHIMDPRTGQPVRDAPSVTVVARSATLADVWATALSALGPEEGFARLPDEIEAMMVLGGADHFRLLATSGFHALYEEGAAGAPEIWTPPPPPARR